MSKIYKVRKAFHKIFSHLKNHEVTCIFFNNDVKILSTLKEYEFHVDHYVLYHTVQNIKCSSITNFAKIIEGMSEIERVQCSLPTTSIVISDGYHTVDDETNIPLAEISTTLQNKFDHSIGLGNDFDQELLRTISNEFHETQNEFMFNFLNLDFYYNAQNHIHIPLDTFFVSLQEFHQEPITEEEYDTTSIHMPSLQLTECGKFQNTYQFEESMVPTVTEKKHYIFVIDISGSMDDCFHSRLVESFYSDVNFFYNTTTDSPVKLSFYDRNPTIYIGHRECETQDETENDKIFKVCQEIHDLETKRENISERMYHIHSRDYGNAVLKKFIKKKFNQLLNATEQKLIMLLHQPISDAPFMNSTSLYQEHLELCPLCVDRERNILFSCCHIVCCFQCIYKILQMNKNQCPICRQPFSWLRKCIFHQNKMKCLRCNRNTVNIFQEPCQHTIICNECWNDDTDTHCTLCQTSIEKKINVNII